ncbi:MAG TPA: DNA topoisomerase IV subunit A [Methanothrix sp.]|jgi:DNA topoisomerase-6 subunit A|uniref:DNA topoisomerase IV subunit A n=1 Tax=Methanothrix sp. TaxID=90426 RepID=UPI002B76B703|nr:DNA topoisomerase IV subunit A [Methanothrix sp.]MDI9417515.1 DNA topoisomerase IV subunit A [Euryarchaeota archaeon]HON36543.1 DNA topoisomerase IV subunit A [Methanothrix sp.]HRU75543.1 DNA topoisomerase IV subunit A [Methanothrix sp.]
MAGSKGSKDKLSSERPGTDPRSKRAEENLLRLAESLYNQFQRGVVPHISLPSRTKSNIEFSSRDDVWVYGDQETMRSVKTVRGAKTLLKTVHLTELLIDEHLKNNRGSTLREIYYISENWDIAKFNEQAESDRLIEDMEIVTNLHREDFHVRPEEDGAAVFGPLRLKEQTRRGEKQMHCQEDVGEAGYQIPFNVDNIEFISHDAQLVMAVETGGMYARLIENGFDEEYKAILVHIKGQPARSTRRIIKRLNTELDLPVVVFTDGDPWSYRIFASIAYGAIKSAHLSEHLVTPKARFLGVQPSDIVDYNLSTDKLTDKDLQALKSELSDPRFANPYWERQIRLQIDLKKKAEQQAFAGKGLDFVTKTYLPERLAEMGII